MKPTLSLSSSRDRCLFLTLLVASLCVLATIAQGQADKNEMTASRIAAGLYLITGAGGNIVVSVGDDGIVMVDDEVAPLVEQTVQALKQVSEKPLKFVINTHYHDDHTGGNSYFHKLAPIVAHENVRTRLEKGGISGNGSSMHEEVKAAASDTLPTITFDSDMVLHINGEDVRVVHFSAAHTDGDAVVFFPGANTVCMGDIFVTYGFPFIDIDSGGSINGMIAAAEEVLAQLPPDAKIIPGHGPVSTPNDLRAYLGMLKETRNAVSRAMEAGQGVAEMKRSKVLDPWKKYSGDFVSEDAFLETLYNSLKKSN